jgi:AcrR family transcriptional regulator
MPSRLERARQDPNSMKARILVSARRVFGEYDYNGTTTRMIAKEMKSRNKSAVKTLKPASKSLLI